MKTKSTYTDAGWDFEEIWDIQEGVTYPYLRTVPLTLDVRSADPDQGSVSESKTSYHQLTETVEAMPEPGYYFSHWTDYGDWASAEASHTFTMRTHRALVAHFSPVPVSWHEVTVDSSLPEGGTASGGGIFRAGDTVPLTAEVAEGHELLGWYDGDTLLGTSPTLDHLVTGDHHIVAVIAPLPMLDVVLEASPPAGGTVSGGGTFLKTTPLTLTATPNPGFTFQGWFLGNTLFSADAAPAFELAGALRLTAVFLRDTGFDAWAADYGLNSVDGALLDIDSDGDGLSNRLEYLSGTSPVDARSHPRVVPVGMDGQGRFRIEFWRRRDTHGVEDFLSYTHDLHHWRDIRQPMDPAHQFTTEVVEEFGLLDRIRITADFGPHPPPSAFFRRGADDTVPDEEPDAQ